MSADKRRTLLEPMLKRSGLQLPVDEPEGRDEKSESAMAEVLKKVSVERSGSGATAKFTDKEATQQMYNAYHKHLRSAIFHEHSVFMNLGYVASDAPQYSTISLPERMMSRKYIKLALEVIGDCDLTGLRLLDVGCGRGGTIHVAHTYFRPRESVGLDLTSGAIEFCQARHRYPNTRFLRGDAEDLPLAGGSFDVVTSIESSHHYPKIEKFYRGVYRVLAEGGHFLYATLLSKEQFERDRRMLLDIGFALEREQDVTRNVLVACEQDRVGVLGGLISPEKDAWIADAVSLPGSETYNDMESGRTSYKIFKLRKPGGPHLPTAQATLRDPEDVDA